MSHKRIVSASQGCYMDMVSSDARFLCRNDLNPGVILGAGAVLALAAVVYAFTQVWSSTTKYGDLALELLGFRVYSLIYCNILIGHGILSSL